MFLYAFSGGQIRINYLTPRAPGKQPRNYSTTTGAGATAVSSLLSHFPCSVRNLYGVQLPLFLLHALPCYQSYTGGMGDVVLPGGSSKCATNNTLGVFSAAANVLKYVSVC